MTSHAGRLYALAGVLVVFFLTWALLAARPWAPARQVSDPRLTALAHREHQLRRDAVLVRRIVARRFARYRVALVRRRAELAAVSAAAPAPTVAAAPAVRVVTLPPLTITRTS